MATQNGVIETASGDLRRAGIDVDFINDGSFNVSTETQRTDVPIPAKILHSKLNAKFHRWNGSIWVEVTQPSPIQIASFTAENGKIYFLDNNAAAGNIVVTNIVTPSIDDWYEVHLKTDHATRKSTINGETLIIAGEFVRVEYDGTSWNNFTHLIASQAQVFRSASQSISNSVTTAIDFDAEHFDVGSLATTGTTPITIRRTGKYLIVANWGTAAVIDDTEFIQTRMNVNGTVAITGTRRSPVASANEDSGVSEPNSLAVGDTVSLSVLHNEGASIATQGSPRQPTLSVQEIL